VKFRIRHPDLKKILKESMQCKASKDSVCGVWRISYAAGKALFYRFGADSAVSISIDAELESNDGEQAFVADHVKLINAIDALKTGKHLSILFDASKGMLDDIEVVSREITNDKIPYLYEKYDSVFSVDTSAERFRVFDKALPIVSDDETRYFMCGVNVTVTDGMVHIAATNGRALFYADDIFYGEPYAVRGEGSVIVPKSLFTGYKKINRVTFGANKDIESKRVFAYTMSYGDGFFVSKHVTCVDGQFPNYRRVVPDFRNDYNFQCDAEGLRGALEKAKVLLPRDRRSAMTSERISLTAGTDGTLSVAAQLATDNGFIDTGDFHVVCRYSGKVSDTKNNTYRVYVNVSYLLSAIPKSGDVKIWFNEEMSKAFVVHSDKGYFVIMPMV
jgi:DNA polymerase III subunit beta